MLHKHRPHTIVKAAPKAGLNHLCWVRACSFTGLGMCLKGGYALRNRKNSLFGGSFSSIFLFTGLDEHLMISSDVTPDHSTARWFWVWWQAKGKAKNKKRYRGTNEQIQNPSIVLYCINLFSCRLRNR